MKRICAWCGKKMGDSNEGKKDDITHGICDKCREKFFPQFKDK